MSTKTAEYHKKYYIQHKAELKQKADIRRAAMSVKEKETKRLKAMLREYRKTPTIRRALTIYSKVHQIPIENINISVSDIARELSGMKL